MKIIALKLTKGAFTKVRTNQLARLPIKKINSFKEKDLSESIAIEVDAMLILNEQWISASLPEKIERLEQKANYIDQKINQLVYQLYALTDEEIKIIEKGAV
jgi:hypothetical protein